MFLNQMHYLWRALGRARGLRVAMLLTEPLALFGLLALVLKGAG